MVHIWRRRSACSSPHQTTPDQETSENGDSNEDDEKPEGDTCSYSYHSCCKKRGREGGKEGAREGRGENTKSEIL